MLVSIDKDLINLVLNNILEIPEISDDKINKYVKYILENNNILYRDSVFNTHLNSIDASKRIIFFYKKQFSYIKTDIHIYLSPCCGLVSDFKLEKYFTSKINSHISEEVNIFDGIEERICKYSKYIIFCLFCYFKCGSNKHKDSYILCENLKYGLVSNSITDDMNERLPEKLKSFIAMYKKPMELKSTLLPNEKTKVYAIVLRVFINSSSEKYHDGLIGIIPTIKDNYANQIILFRDTKTIVNPLAKKLLFVDDMNENINECESINIFNQEPQLLVDTNKYPLSIEMKNINDTDAIKLLKNSNNETDIMIRHINSIILELNENIYRYNNMGGN